MDRKDTSLWKQIAEFIKEHRKNKIWRGVTNTLAVLVVFVTTYALILPAITMTAETVCGLEEHTHSEECYLNAYDLSMIQQPCKAQLHTHTYECYEEGELTCGWSDFYVHSHSAACYDATGALICTLPQVYVHQHTDACYQEGEGLTCGQEELPAHVHDESCYASDLEFHCEIEANHVHGDGCYASGVICGQEESAGHTHTESCVVVNRQLTCGQNETAGHTHGDGCFGEDGALVCTLAESAGHAHSDACYTDVAEYTCGMEETAGHVHTDACYGQTLVCTIPENHVHEEASCFVPVDVLTCTLEESEGHTHTEECFGAEPELICTRKEVVLHTHVDSCFETVKDASGNDIRIVTCGKPEVREHTHTAECYDAENLAAALASTTLVCELEEHTHDDLCYAAEETTEEVTEEATEEATEGATEEATEAATEPVDTGIADLEDLMAGMTEEELAGLNELLGVDTLEEPVDAEGSSGPAMLDVSNVTATNTSYNGKDFTTHLKVEFENISKENIISNGYSYYYPLPENVTVPESSLGVIFEGRDTSNKLGFKYQYLKDEDGNLYVDIKFEKSYIDTAGATVSGYFEFDASIKDDGWNGKDNIVLDFAETEPVIIPPGDVDMDDNISAGSDMKVEKRSFGYNNDTNSITYQITVSSTKGTESEISLEDVLTANGVSISSVEVTEVIYQTKKTEWEYNASQQLDINSLTPPPSFDPATNKLTISLPEMEGTNNGDADVTGSRYQIKYTVYLDGADHNLSTVVGNKVTGTSLVNDKTEGEITSETDTTTNVNINVLSKKGEFDKETGKIKWVITVNPSHANIAGATLSDAMFAEAVGNIDIQPENGWEFVKKDGKVVGIEFVATDTNTNTNTDKYTITYETLSDTTLGSQDRNEKNVASIDGTINGNAENTVYTEDGELTKSKSDVSYVDSDNDGKYDLAIISWTAQANIPAGGISKDTVIYDYLSGDNYQNVSDHWYTYNQIEAIYDSNKDVQIVGSDGSAVGTTSDVTFSVYDKTEGKWIDFKEIQGELKGHRFTAWSIKFNSDVSVSGPGTINWNYCSTADLTNIQNTQRFSNKIKVNGLESTAQHEEAVAIVKMDGKENPEDSKVTSNGKLYWKVRIFANSLVDQDSITVVDQLPAGVTLNKIYLSRWGNDKAMEMTEGENGTVNLSYKPGSAEQYITGNITTTGDGKDVQQTVTVTIPKECFSSVTNEGYIWLYYECQLSQDLIGDAEQITINDLTNEVFLKGESDKIIDTDSHTQDVDYSDTTHDENYKKVTKSCGWDDANHKLNYSVVLNGKGEELSASGDMLKVVDDLGVNYDKNYGWGYTAALLHDTVKFYKAEYDSSTGTYNKGEELSIAWKYDTYIDENSEFWTFFRIHHVITAMIPDGTPIIMEYAYSITSVTEGNQYLQGSISNTVTLYGDSKDSANTSAQGVYSDDGHGAGIITDGHIYFVYKVDAGNYAATLPGAEFELYKYENGNWISTGIEYTSNESGTFVVTKQSLIEGKRFAFNTAYKLVEKKAPEGYQLGSDLKLWFYWSGDVTEYPESMPADFKDDAKDLTHYSVTDYVPNTPIPMTDASVEKKWLDSTGADKSEGLPNSVTVDLYCTLSETPPSGSNGGDDGETSDESTFHKLSLSYGAYFAYQYKLYDNVSFVPGQTLSITLDFHPDNYSLDYPVVQNNNSNVAVDEGINITCKDYLTDEGKRGKIYNVKIVLPDEDVNYGVMGTDVVTAEIISSGTTEPETPTVTTGHTQAEIEALGGTKYNDARYQNITLNADNGWKFTTEKDLPVSTTVDGKTMYYHYYFVEHPVAGYEPSYDSLEGVQGGTFVVKNQEVTGEQQYTSINVTKNWKYNGSEEVVADSDKKEVVLYLFQKVGDGTPVQFGTITLNSNNDWIGSFSNLPHSVKDTDDSTVNYTYYIAELEAVDGKVAWNEGAVDTSDPIEVTIDGTEVIAYKVNTTAGETADAAQVIVTNTVDQPRTVKVEKRWYDYDGVEIKDSANLPEGLNITLTLYQVKEDGTAVPYNGGKDWTTTTTDNINTVTLPRTEEPKWSYTWENLTGDDIVSFFVKETAVTIEGENGEPANVIDDYNIQYSTNNGESWIEVDRAEDAKVDGIPTTDSNGTQITPTIQIKNQITKKYTNLEVSKTVSGKEPNGQFDYIEVDIYQVATTDGVKGEAVKFNTESIKLSAATGWKYLIEDLPLEEKGANGHVVTTYTYYVVETGAYKVEGDEAKDILANYGIQYKVGNTTYYQGYEGNMQLPVDEEDGNKVTINNIPETTTAVTVEKQWMLNGDEFTPSNYEATFRLYYTKEAIDPSEIPDPSEESKPTDPSEPEPSESEPAPSTPVEQITIIFDANGENVNLTETSKVVVKGAAIGILPEPTRDGYTFAGWYTGENGSGHKVDTSTVFTSNTTLYAHWKELETEPTQPAIQYTVTFDHMAKTSTTPEIITSVTAGQGEYITLPTGEYRQELTSDDETFIHWKDSSGKTYPAGNQYQVNGDVTLTAVWSYRISYFIDGEDVTNKYEPKTHIWGTATQLPKPEKEGATFDGWYWDKDYTKNELAATIYADHNNVTNAYGRWNYSVNVTSGGNGTVTASPTSNVHKGDTVTLTINPNSGYQLDQLTVTRTDSNETVTVSGDSNIRTFQMPASSVNVNATFKTTGGGGGGTVTTYSVTVKPSANGTVSADKISGLKQGDTVNLTVNPDTGYELDTLTVTDGNNQTVTVSGTGNERTFQMPASNVTVTATFKQTSSGGDAEQVTVNYKLYMYKGSDIQTAVNYESEIYKFSVSYPKGTEVTLVMWYQWGRYILAGKQDAVKLNDSTVVNGTKVDSGDAAEFTYKFVANSDITLVGKFCDGSWGETDTPAWKLISYTGQADSSNDSSNSGGGSGNNGGSTTTEAPTITEGADQFIGSADQDVVITSNADFDTFQSVIVNGETLTKDEQYTVSQGSTIVTLKKDYIATLQDGQYTISIVSSTGTATTSFILFKDDNEEVAVSGSLRILGIGDSITAGDCYSDAYVTMLQTKLKENGYTVAAFDRCANTGFPIQRFDIPSGRTGGILELIQNCTFENPNVILLIAGTNDILSSAIDSAQLNGNELGNINTRITRLVTNIHQKYPDAKILVGSVPNLDLTKVYEWLHINWKYKPNGGGAYPEDEVKANVQTAIDNYNSFLRSMAAGLSYVHFVDINGSITDLTNDLTDGCHPNEVGYQKMANAWYDALVGILPAPTSADETEEEIGVYGLLDEETEPTTETAEANGSAVYDPADTQGEPSGWNPLYLFGIRPAYTADSELFGQSSEAPAQTGAGETFQTVDGTSLSLGRMASFTADEEQPANVQTVETADAAPAAGESSIPAEEQTSVSNVSIPASTGTAATITRPVTYADGNNSEYFGNPEMPDGAKPYYVDDDDKVDTTKDGIITGGSMIHKWEGLPSIVYDEKEQKFYKYTYYVAEINCVTGSATLVGTSYDDNGTSHVTVTNDLKNPESIILPETGGMGTTRYTLSGAAMIAFAMLAQCIYTRQKLKTERSSARKGKGGRSDH